MTRAVGVQDDAGWFTAAIAEELRAQMARKRISGREVARRLHVSAQWISQRTRGVVPVSTDEIERICSVIGVPVYELVGAAARQGDSGNSQRFYAGGVTPQYPSDSSNVVTLFPQVSTSGGYDGTPVTRAGSDRPGELRPGA